MTNMDAEIILALADNNMNVSEASRKIFVHRNTLNYHFKKILKETGLNPCNFYDLSALVPIARNVFESEVVNG